MKNLLNIPLMILTFMVSCGFYSCSDNPVVSWKSETGQAVNEHFILNVYIENSGSMDGYMCSGSQLKDAVYSYVSALDSYADTTALNYINSVVIPYKGGVKSFIKDLNPLSFKKAGGNTANSDITNMLEKIISANDTNVVSIFVSDCILDVPEDDASKYFHLKKIELKNALVKGLNKNKNLSIEILRLKSAFTGRYFYNHGFEKLEDVERPYYMWVIGDKSKLATLHKKVPYSGNLEHGYENIFSWSTPSNVDFEICNKHGMASNDIILRNVEKDDKYHFFIKVNMKNTLQDDTVLCSTQYYKKNNSFIDIEGVSMISSKEKNYTHILDVALSPIYNSAAENIVFLAPTYPSWGSEVNDDTGNDIKSNLNKTTGIKYLLEGIANAYKDKNELFSLKFVINKNKK